MAYLRQSLINPIHPGFWLKTALHLLTPGGFGYIRKLRRMMTDLQPVEAMETLIAALKKHKTNAELLGKLG